MWGGWGRGVGGQGWCPRGAVQSCSMKNKWDLNRWGEDGVFQRENSRAIIWLDAEFYAVYSACGMEGRLEGAKRMLGHQLGDYYNGSSEK